MPQRLKLFHGVVNERAIPTEKFLKQLNQHLDLFKRTCGQQFLMFDKNDKPYKTGTKVG